MSDDGKGVIRTGVKATAPVRIVMSRLSAAYPQCYNQVCVFRRELETEVEAVYGRIDISLANEINLACRWELTARVLEHLIAHKLSDDVARDMRSASLASEKRAIVVRKLKLNRQRAKGPKNDEWAAMDAEPDE